MEKLDIISSVFRFASSLRFVGLFYLYWKDERLSEKIAKKRDEFVYSLADTVSRLNLQIRTLTEDASRLRREVKELRDKVEQIPGGADKLGDRA